MSRIYKYDMTISTGEIKLIQMPKWATILDAQMQKDRLCMWALITGEDPEIVKRQFVIHGTGHEFDHKRLNYISTIQVGVYVWHLFENFPEPKGPHE